MKKITTIGYRKIAQEEFDISGTAAWPPSETTEESMQIPINEKWQNIRLPDGTITEIEEIEADVDYIPSYSNTPGTESEGVSVKDVRPRVFDTNGTDIYPMLGGKDKIYISRYVEEMALEELDSRMPENWDDTIG